MSGFAPDLEAHHRERNVAPPIWVGVGNTGPMNELESIQAAATALSPWAHIATVGADGRPDVVPVHPAWEGDTLWFMAAGDSVKVRNIAHHADVAMHWQVSEAGDGVEVWGTATVHQDLATKRRLWTGVFDYDLYLFSPGGPEDSPNTVFVGIQLDRAISMKAYGLGGRVAWRSSTED